MKKPVVFLITMLITILFLLMQINFLNTLPAFGIISNIGIVLISAIGITAGSNSGGLLGAFYGIVIDAFFSKTLGIFFLLYILVGIISGYLKNNISKDNKMSLALMVVINTLMFELSLCFFTCYLYGTPFNFLFLLKVIIIEELYNIFLTYIFFRPLIYWGEIINRSRDSYYLLH